MMMRLAVTLLLAIGTCACSDDNGSVIGPSPTSSLVPPAAPPVVRLHGGVADSAFRPLAGARVEIISGLGAGVSADTDRLGRFVLSGSFDETSEVRVSKDGHLTASRAIGRTCQNCPIDFYLAVPGPPVNLVGNYTVSFLADSTCDLPVEARRRTYPATIVAEADPGVPNNRIFDVIVGGSTFLADFAAFRIGVAGDYMAIWEQNGEPWLVEEFERNTYLAIGGNASTAVGAAGSTISMPLDGTIEYCQMQSTMWNGYNCSSAIARGRCTSTNHRVILAPR